MRARVTLAVGLPYQIDRVTLAENVEPAIVRRRLP